MKMYAIFPNQKSGLIEEQFIETENYTADELRNIAFYDILFNNLEEIADAVIQKLTEITKPIWEGRAWEEVDYD